MSSGAAINNLRALMDSTTAARDERWQKRYDEIPQLVEGAAAKFGEPAKGGIGREWPSPQPLPDGLSPVAAFKFDLLPERVRPWVGDICERMQCPADYVAVSLMAARGSMIGRKVAIRPQVHDDWTVIAEFHTSSESCPSHRGQRHIRCAALNRRSGTCRNKAGVFAG
jgi:hypothetical protein